MFGTGGSLIAANAQADRDRGKACRVFSVSVTAVTGAGILAAFLGTAFRPQMIAMLCSDLSLRADVSEYYSVLGVDAELMEVDGAVKFTRTL